MRAVLIANPNASTVTSAGRRVAERALEATFDLELVTTDARGHAAQLARDAVEAGAKTVIAYGGDGTANEVVNGLLSVPDHGTVLAVLPGGGTNVLARNLGFPNDLVEATAHLLDVVDGGEPAPLKLGRLTLEGEHGHLERYFTFAAGAVLDADAVRRVDEAGSRARYRDLGFMWHTTRAYFALRKVAEPQLLIPTDDGDQAAWWAIVAVSDPFTYLGKRAVRATPGTTEHDGVDLIAAKHKRFWQTLRWVQQALGKGKHIQHADAIFRPGLRSVRMRGVVPVPVHADGEVLGDATIIGVEAVPSALSVWA